MTPAEFKSLRHSIGLSAAGMAHFLKMGDSGGRTVRRWEAGDSAIPGSVGLLLTAIRDSAEVRAHFGLTLSE